MTLQVQCPKCKNTMLYHSIKPEKMALNMDKARKACVYCGTSFKVKDRIVKQQ